MNSKDTDTDLIWLEKYRPKYLKDYLDFQRFESIVKEYINPIKSKGITYKPFLILYGDPGVGKTSLAHCLYNDYDYDKIECNASETRTKKILSELINTGKNSVIFGSDGKLKKPGLIMDEIDGISTGECNGIKTLIDFTILEKIKKGCKEFQEYEYSSIIKKGLFQYKVRYPVICTANSIKEKKIKPLLDLGILVRVYKPSMSSLLDLAKKIDKAEELHIGKQLLREIISVCKPEYRCIIIFLHEIYLYKLTLPNDITIKNRNKCVQEHIYNKIYNFQLNNQLSQYVNLPINNIVSNLITHYPYYLKFINDITKLNNEDNAQDSHLKDNNCYNNCYNNLFNKVLKFKKNYINELNSLIQVDNNLINYNIIENYPIIIQEICNNKLFEISNKSNNKQVKINKLIKSTLNLLSLSNKLMKISNIWREYIEINKEWDLQDYCNMIIVYILIMLNQYNYDFGKTDKGCNTLNVKYHVKYNTMKQYLGILNNQIIFHYSDITGEQYQLQLQQNTNKNDNTNKYQEKKDSMILFQGKKEKSISRQYFNTKQHLISYDINGFYMYYQLDDIINEPYDKKFEIGLNKIKNVLSDIQKM